MGILSSLASGGIQGIITGVSDAADKFIQTPDEKSAIELKKMALGMQAQLQQLEVNKEQAKSSSIFVAGSRPAILWVCAASLAYTYILQPLLNYAVTLYDPTIPLPPSLDTGTLMPLILGLLGLGGMRSFEKFKGVHRDSLK